MSAADIAHTLGEARREGSGWRCRCPLHGGRSLVVRDGEQGRLLFTCWGGCNRNEVLGELDRIGLLNASRSNRQEQLRESPRKNTPAHNATHTALALRIWDASQPIKSTPAEQYLLGRGILLNDLPVELCTSLRFHPQCLHPSGVKLPAMVALVERVGAGPLAIHRTYICADGSGKVNIEPAKASLGSVGGGAVLLGKPRTGERLVVAEGIETTLSVMLACGLSGRAALSAIGLKNLVLPPSATSVLICSDNDANSVGQNAARMAAERFAREGRLVRIAIPPTPGADFNDILNLTSQAIIDKELSHIA